MHRPVARTDQVADVVGGGDNQGQRVACEVLGTRRDRDSGIAVPWIPVEERWAFFSDLQAGKQVDPEASLPQLIDATRGLTHVLDQVVRDARRAQSEAVTFGSGAEAVALTSDQVIAVAQALARRPREELAVLHEQLISDAEQAEATRAAAIAAEQKLAAKVDLDAQLEGSKAALERQAVELERSGGGSSTSVAVIVIGSALAIGLAIVLFLLIV